MEDLVRHVLKTYFEDYVDGLDRKIDCRQFPVRVRDLKIKEQRIKEDMDDSSFEFLDGIVGIVEMQLSWSGQLEVLVSDLRLNFGFNPIKAMKKALLGEAEPRPVEDAESDVENQVPIDVQQLLAARAPGGPGAAEAAQPPAGPGPRFCQVHDSSQKRAKGAPRWYHCESCRGALQTTYALARLCPSCSARDHRCMCCASPAANPPAGPGGPGGWNQESPQQGPPQPPPQPSFCSRHATSELRPKAGPRMGQCGSCQASLHTNYVEFSLCPACSQRQCRCLICAASAAGPATRAEEEVLRRERSLPPPPPPPAARNGSRANRDAASGAPPSPSALAPPLARRHSVTVDGPDRRSQSLERREQGPPRQPPPSPGLRQRGCSVERGRPQQPAREQTPLSREIFPAAPPAGASPGTFARRLGSPGRVNCRPAFSFGPQPASSQPYRAQHG